MNYACTRLYNQIQNPLDKDCVLWSWNPMVYHFSTLGWFFFTTVILPKQDNEWVFISRPWYNI